MSEGLNCLHMTSISTSTSIPTLTTLLLDLVTVCKSEGGFTGCNNGGGFTVCKSGGGFTGYNNGGGFTGGGKWDISGKW